MKAILVAGIPWMVVFLCVLLFVPWVLGTPGDPDAAYADGWRVGFYAIVLYPLFMLALATIGGLKRLSGLWPAIAIVRPLAWAALAVSCMTGIAAVVLILT